MSTTTGHANRVAQRRKMVALAAELKAQGLRPWQMVAAFEERGYSRSYSAIIGYLRDPEGTKDRARKRKYRGRCANCGRPTALRISRHCRRCYPVLRRIEEEQIVEAMLDWHGRFGWVPTSYDWNRGKALKRGGEALERLAVRDWPSSQVVSARFKGGWPEARERALEAVEARETEASVVELPRAA